MKHIIIGAHLRREDIEPLATPLDASPLVLSGFPIADDQPLGDRELLLRVAAVRAQLLEQATFVAVRYGFAARSAGEAASRCAPHLGRWRSLLEQHRDDVEMTLKVAASSPRPRPERAAFSSGAGYLRALHEASITVEVDAAFRAAVDRSVGALASQALWIHRDSATVELAILIPRAGMDAVMAAAKSLKHEFPRVPFLLSGPWPLEVFADADHE